MSKEVGVREASSGMQGHAVRGGRPFAACELLAVLLLALACACGFALAGCTSESAEPAAPREISKTESFPVIVAAGTVSIEMPEGYAVPEGFGTRGPQENSYGLVDNVICIAQNESGSVALNLCEVTKPDGAEAVGLNAIREQIASAPENREKLKQSMPEYYESIKDLQYGEPESVVICGRDALILENQLDGASVVYCYIEQDGCIVASAQLTMPTSEYQENKQLYESILATIDIAA